MSEWKDIVKAKRFQSFPEDMAKLGEVEYKTYAYRSLCKWLGRAMIERTIKSYKDVVKEAKRTIADRLRAGSYKNNNIEYVTCRTWDAGDQINLWTYWQGYQLEDIDTKGVDILVVGQDWGCAEKHPAVCKSIAAIQAGNPSALYFSSDSITDRNLAELFLTFGCKINSKNPGMRLFFTNYSLGYRGKDISESGGMTKELMKQDEMIFDELVSTIKPKIIICLGKITYEMVTGNTAKGFIEQLSKGLPFTSIFHDSDIRVYGVAHPGARGVSNIGGMEKMFESWAYIVTEYRKSFG